MRALRSKIKPIMSGGIPGEVRKINELIEAVNHLFGMQTINGQPIADGATGPIIDLSQVASPSTPVAAPWEYDPYGNLAGWLICENGNYWGTGLCPKGAGCQNFETDSSSTSGFGSSPEIRTSHPASPPITIPSSCQPVIYLVVPKTLAGGDPQPNLTITNGLGSGTALFTFTFAITYDGTTIFTVSGSGTATSTGPTTIPLPVANFVFDPGGLPGYTHVSNNWVFEYNGAASGSTSPPIIQTFTWTSTTTLAASFWTPVYLEP